MKCTSFFIIIFLMLLSSASNATNVEEVLYAKNYLIILVHGIGDDHNCFNNVKTYLESNGLTGYVYAYEFSDKFLNIEKEGWEFGDRTYDNPEAVSKKNNEIGHNGNMRKPWEITKSLDNGQGGRGKCWLEQAKEDFAINNPGKAIPPKFIVIAHSMGGLAVRSYILGKDRNGQRYYQDDIEKVVYIDTPHLGSTAGKAAIWAEDNKSGRYLIPSVFLASAWVYGGVPFLDTKTKSLLACSGGYALAGSGLFDLNLTVLNRHKTPALEDMLPGSQFLNNLNRSTLGEREAILQRIIVGRGAPTPQDLDSFGGYFYNLQPHLRVFDSLMNAITSGHLTLWEEKMMSINLTTMSGYPFYEDGDLVVTTKSQRGEGIANLSDAKILEHSFESPTIRAGLTATNAIFDLSIFLPAPADIILAMAASTLTYAYTQQTKDGKEYSEAHVTMKDKIVIEEGLLDKTLFESIQPAGASSIYSVNQIPFKITSNITIEAGEKKTLATYHDVSIEAMTESKAIKSSGVPIVIDGKEKNISMFTVKEPPTKIEGVLRDFMPKKMQYFQYSENFSAWKDIAIQDEWGKFQIDGLKLAEGQNVIALRAKNKVGYSSNQILNITVNTIPMLATNVRPLPGTYTNNNRPKFTGVFSKAAYSGTTLEAIELDYAKLICETRETDVTQDVKFNMSGGPYDKHGNYEFVPSETLPDGEYLFVIGVKSNVGTSRVISNIIIDTTSPTVTVATLEPYSARAPATIRYSISDETSPIIKKVLCNLYNENETVKIQIASSESQSPGENYFLLRTDSPFPDGTYTLQISAFDLAGNHTVANTPLKIDSTPPTISGIDFSPNPMTSKTTEMALTARVSEQSQVFIKLVNTSKNDFTTTYFMQTNLVTENNSLLASAFPWINFKETPSFIASYTWKYGNELTPGPEDGVYRVEVTARDIAGNESLVFSREGFVINRTPPQIYAQTAMPYVLPNSGVGAYKTTAYFKVKPDKPVRGNIKIYNSNTTQLVGFPRSFTDEREIKIDASDAGSYPKGSYKVQINIEDEVGNINSAYTSFVKDGISPTISFPAENGEIATGIIAIRGTAIDPDWTNDKPFKQYRVFIKGNGANIPCIEVPPANRGTNDKSTSQRSVQNDSTLAYLNTNLLENGTYTIVVEVIEDGGETLQTERTIKVENSESRQENILLPYIQLKRPIPSVIDFDNSVVLPIGFSNSIKPANVYVELLKDEKMVFFKYFPNVLGTPFEGRPKYTAGRDLGYFMWKDDDGPSTGSGATYHLRFSSNNETHKFTGNIVCLNAGALTEVKTIGNGIQNRGQIIYWDRSLSKSEGGIDFKAGSGKIMVMAQIDSDPANPDVYANQFFMGASKYTTMYLPIMFDAATQHLIDITQIGQNIVEAAPANYERSTQIINWDGKYDTGGFADSGNYIIRVRAEGADGVGVVTDEATIKIITPFDLQAEATNKEFAPLSPIDCATIKYSVSKDSIITATVLNDSNKQIATIIDNQTVLGVSPTNPYSFSWKGNYPNVDSGTVVDSGTYKIVIKANSIDGKDHKTVEIPGIQVKSFQTGNSAVKLDAIGPTLEGESPFYFEAKGIGNYHPPNDFNYTLKAKGTTRISAYPYVPYAGLMHRGFRQVDILVKAKIKAEGSVYVFMDRRHGGRYQTHDVSAIFNLRDKGGPYFTPVENFGRWFNLNWNESDPKLEKGEAQIEIYSKDGSFILDSAEAWIKDTDGFVKTSKGMFEVRLEGARVNDGNDYLAKVQIKLPDNSPIEYSRLTNRFVPFVGFVNTHHATSEDYSDKKYTFDIQRGLAFPGKDFFNDARASLETAFPPDLAQTLQAKWDQKDAKSFRAVETAINDLLGDSNLKGYQGQAYGIQAIAGFDKYLSDGYYEFIYITTPECGAFQYTKDSSLVSASTTLEYKWDENGRPSPFEFSWPSVQSEYDIEKGKQNEQQITLLKTPQSYTGITQRGTFWELDENEWNDRKNDNNTVILAGRTLFNKSAGKSTWESDESLGQQLKLNDYVLTYEYSVESGSKDIIVNLSSKDKNGHIKAEDKDTVGLSWTTSNDATLSTGVIQSPQLVFNDVAFCSTRTFGISSAYSPSNDSPISQCTFLKGNPDSIIDNPYLVISSWGVKVKDKANEINKDIKLFGNVKKASQAINDQFILKLDPKAPEVRYVEIKGKAPGAYELLFFDGKDWKAIASSNSAKEGTLAWWNVSRLNGKHTILLRSNGFVDSQEINIGTMINKDQRMSAWSAYKRAELDFPAGAFTNEAGVTIDKLVTITPVSIDEIKIRNRPIIISHGPIVEIKPSPWKFTNEQKPKLKFIYSFDDLKELGYWSGAGTPSDLLFNIYQITEAGDLQLVSDNKQEIENNNGEDQYVFSALLDHFSTYGLLKGGKFSLSAPIVFADRYITNKDYATIYGTAEPGARVTVYVCGKQKTTFVDDEKENGGYSSAETGSFKFEGIKLLKDDGKNYIYVTSHLDINPSIETWSDLEIVKDTIPPSIEASQNLYAFSPNGDGRFDSADFIVKSSERSKICLQLTTNNRQPLALEISAEANKDIKFVLSAKDELPDGKYSITVYAIDEAGNISQNILKSIVVDTTPPQILSLSAAPNPFTPNDDGVKDTTKISYKLSEPAYVTLNINDPDNQLFRNFRESTKSFFYPTNPQTHDVSHDATATDSYSWDGRGSRNELVGGTYNYQIIAEDNVGNAASSEIKSVVVDRVPTLVPYAYADPDPFSPVNPDNDFTEIKYYLSRDNLKVRAWVVGQGGKPLKVLAWDEIMKKGKNKLKWYGDFDSSYIGPTAYRNKYKVSDGSYEFRLQVEDPNEPGSATAEVSNTVLVDNVPPYIYTKPVKIDKIQKKAFLSYNIPEKSTVEVYVYNLQDELLATLVSGEIQNPGFHGVSFFDNNPEISNKYFKIVATDRAKNTASATTEAFTLSIDELQVVNASAVPQTFTPNSDGQNDQIRISYSVMGGIEPYKVSVNIADFGGATVKKLTIDEEQLAGNYSLSWDGLKEDKTKAPTGNYKYQIIAEDITVKKVVKEGAIVLVAEKPIVTISTNYPKISLSGTSQKNTITFSYSIDYPVAYIPDPALVKLEVLDSALKTVWSQTFQNTPGQYSCVWDGKDKNGQTVNGGQYYVKISATDALNNSAIPKTASFAVENSTPNISIVYLSPSLFSPHPNGIKDQTVVSYSLAKDAYVTVEARVKGQGARVKKIMDNEWTQAYIPIMSGGIKAAAVPTVVWDGKSDDNELVPDGSYDMYILAVDEAGNAYDTYQTVVVDNATPMTPEAETLPAYTNIKEQTISGTAESGSLVELYNNENLTASKTISSESFAFPMELLLGQNNIKVRSTDPAGNVSDNLYFKTTTYETTTPVISNISVYPNPAKVGTVVMSFEVSEQLVGDPTIKVNEGTATFSRRGPNSNKYEYIYNVTSSDAQGKAVISIEVEDLSGNMAVKQDSQLVIDTIAPSAPTINLLPSYTNIAKQKMKGTADPDSVITIFNNNKIASQETANSKGEFESNVLLSLGDNGFYAVSTDSAYNTSEAGNLQKVIFDTENPVISDISVSKNPAKQERITVSFNVSKTLKSDPVVMINSLQCTVDGKKPKAKGAFEYEYAYNVSRSDKQGEASISIEVVDLSGNTAAKQYTKLIIDTIAPVISNIKILPELTKAGTIEIDFTISETLESNPSVKVNLETATLGRKFENQYKYIYDITSSDAQGKAVVSIEVVDLALNTAAKSLSDTLSIDTVTPVTPTMYSLPTHVNYQEITISGEAEPGSQVAIYKNDDLAAETSSDKKGFWSKQVDLELGKNIFYVISTDPAGNQSLASDKPTIIFDTENPVFSKVSVSKNPAKAGPLTIKFLSSKTLKIDPVVKVNSSQCAVDGRGTGEGEIKKYEYLYKITTLDAQGTAQISIEGEDLAGNVGIKTSEFVIDTVSPEVSNVSVSARHAKVGETTIRFTLSETLESNPIVKVNMETVPMSHRGQFPRALDYEYAYDVSQSDKQGTAEVYIEVSDLAKNPSTYKSKDILSIDTIEPVISDVEIKPKYAKLGSRVTVDFGVSEILPEDPVVNIGDFTASIESKSTSGEAVKYLYSYEISGKDSEGKNDVDISVVDFAGNPVKESYKNRLVVDRETPQIIGVKAVPSLAKSGEAKITFTLSETLESNPIVKVNMETVPMSHRGQFPGALDYEYVYDVSQSTVQGPAEVYIEVSDLAKNPSTYKSKDILSIDTIAPVISDVEIEPKYAKLGAKVVVDFNVSEVLLNDPVVSAGDNALGIESKKTQGRGVNYSYSYIVLSKDIEGENVVKISIEDLAKNAVEESYKNRLIVDREAPQISSVEATPSLAKAGQVKILFGVSEALESNPIVNINNLTATFSRWFENTYEYVYNVSESDKQGPALIYIEVSDLAKNKADYQSSGHLSIDTIKPTINDVDLKPKYAKLGSRVVVDFRVSESLKDNPVVTVGDNPAAFELKTVRSLSEIDYSYSYAIGANDPEGETDISIKTEDPAGNIAEKKVNDYLVVDKINPEVSGIEISPNPAKAGKATISFRVSEPLRETPKVYVKQNGISPSPANVKGDWDKANGKCDAEYDVVGEHDGTAETSINVVDLAGNVSTKQNSDLVIDTITPTFSNIQSVVIGNSEFNKYAKDKDDVSITFRSSEGLKFDPEVRINKGRKAKQTSRINNEYTYNYTINGSDTNGQATIEISGFDFANNEGLTVTSKESESFIVDMVKPTVDIPTDTDIIANPSPFFTNSNSNDPARTTITYGISKYGKTMVKIYKIPNNTLAQNLTRADFRSDNYIKPLVNAEWLQPGTHIATWDGTYENNSKAAPGKYAFTVDVKDMAGNVVEHLWGGTCWIQNNVMRLKGPDQRDAQRSINSNPDPSLISPNGNSTNPSQKKSIIYFRVDLGVTPQVAPRPEPIFILEASDISWDATRIKQVGYYSVKILNSSGTVIKTIANDVSLSSGILISATWEGKDDNGNYVDDGTYRPVVTVKDFLNAGPVENNLVLNDIVIDNSSPNKPSIIADAGHTPKNSWSSHDTPYLTWVDPGDNSGSGVVSYQQQIDGGTWLPAATPWHLEPLSDGTHTVKVKAIDRAGNEGASDEATFKIDTRSPNAPTISSSGPPQNTWSTDNKPIFSWNDPGDNGGSGVSYYRGFIDGVDQGNVSTGWQPTLSDGIHAVKIRAYDGVGLYSDSSTFSFNIDVAPPYFSQGPDVDVSHVPDRVWSNHNSPKVTYTAADATSSTRVAWLEWDGTAWQFKEPSVSSPWERTLTDGMHWTQFVIFDSAGNYKGSPVYGFVIDTTAPNAPSVESSGPTQNTWSNNNRPSFTWGNPGDNGGSGVSYYKGFIDGVDQGSVSIGWNPTLTDGSHTICVRAVDGVGLSTDSSTMTFKIDRVGLGIYGSSAATLNPYVEGSKRIDFWSQGLHDDQQGSFPSVRIMSGTTKVKDLAVIDERVSGNRRYGSIIWDGKNNSEDYVNEGDYKLAIEANDDAGNISTRETWFYIRDDQQIASGAIPGIEINGNLYLRWINGSRTESNQTQARGAGTGGGCEKKWIYIENNNCSVTLTVGHGGGSQTHGLAYADREGHQGTYILWWDGDETKTISLNRGWYMIEAGASSGWPSNSWASTTATWMNTWQNQFTRNCAADFANNIINSASYSQSGPTENPTYSGGPSSITNNGVTHSVRATGNDICYKRGNSSDIVISKAGGYDPCIVVDNSGNAYAAWQRSGKIYFQKIPEKFAPINGSVTATSINVDSIFQTKEAQVQTQALEKPTLLSPSDQSTVTTLRPTFKWQGIRGITNYEIRMSELATVPISPSTRTLPKNITQSEASPVDGSNPTIAYAINEFDEGIAKGTWYWLVAANPNTTSESSSDIWSFTIDPPLSLTGITNFPNPFNPNREQTKIRYCLGRDADSVKIRIYDITGGLVNELDGFTNGEGSSIWNKYNDVPWDGRNAKGDMVVNGIYPFEIVASYNGQSVSGRGKMAVLK